ncbi:MAG: isoleucine--tRNA ligase [Verrucomicrobia bacterium]|nr:isoleucine--tRNA ligase [Verrucomicrobiota bacterium]MBV9300175.1 isoleucine--tRNA ligase [Verrucomicrobiota bacterium]
MNYKETLNLPRTEFPMKANLTSREPEILARWNAEHIYAQIQEVRKDGPLFVLHDGPPFANGDVHMGTALNKILKDLIVKSRAMAGFRAPYIPGWDCHGLPIEFKVVKESKGLSPLEVRKRSEAYARKYIDIQRRQFRRLGVFGDWEHPYLTLDPSYEAIILRVFAELVEKGLVYQSKKPVFWSTGAQTALAEAEVEYKERTDPSIYVEFPIRTGPFSGKASIVIWTTTPWTIPANLAISVHPVYKYLVQEFRHPEQEKERVLLMATDLVSHFQEETGWRPVGEPFGVFAGADMEKWLCRHPFLDRNSIVLLSETVTLEAGTGCVHTAPGHGEEDYQIGLRYGLPLLSPVDDDGRYTEEVGIPEWVGKYVFDANKDVIHRLVEVGCLLAANDYHHTYPNCWRSKTPVIFRAIEQFFIRVDALKSAALQSIDRVTWIPHWGRNRIYATVESRPDWCISRQRSWGVPLPVFYDGRKPILNPGWIRKMADLVEHRGTNLWYELGDAALAKELGLPEVFQRRNDTLDVWIDSGVSHEAVLRRHPALRWPADVYIEATDQHRGWFNSSLLTSIALNREAPYREVLTHAFVVDVDSRRKISKSDQGGYAKPTEAEHYINKYGADIVRLWVSSVNYTDEVPFGETIFGQLADTYRRIRNTLRILLGNLHDFNPAKDRVPDPTLIDRWAASRLQQVIQQCAEAYQRYEFHKVYHALNQFCAVDLSSLYIDMTKDRMYCDAASSHRRRATQTVLHKAFDTLVRLIAPILVFTAEEAWSFSGKSTSVHLERLPEPDPSQVDLAAIEMVDALLAARSLVAQSIETARQQKLIGNSLEAHVVLSLPREHRIHQLHLAEVEEFLILSHLDVVAIDGDSKAAVTKTPYPRCERCWRHRCSVGLQPDHPSLCDRCAEVVSEPAIDE